MCETSKQAGMIIGGTCHDILLLMHTKDYDVLLQ